MIILLIIYLLFIFAYTVFNVYAISRVWSMRIQGDKTNLAIAVYSVIIVIILILSILAISFLDWNQGFGNIFG